jgi:hypothetical protein
MEAAIGASAAKADFVGTAVPNLILSQTFTCRSKADAPHFAHPDPQIAAAQHYVHQIAKLFVNAAINAHWHTLYIPVVYA